MATKNSWKLTTKPTKKSTLTGTDTTRGGGPDEGNVGYNKDVIYRHGKHRKKWREEMEKRKKKPERIMTPYRAKKGVGGIAKIIGKKAVDWIKKNRKTIKKEIYSPEGKKKTQELTKKLQEGLKKPGHAKGGRIGYQSGGRTNLLEELGRVEGERSNKNRRAEISRVHGELNRGYKHGGPVGAAKRGFNKKILRKD